VASSLLRRVRMLAYVGPSIAPFPLILLGQRLGFSLADHSGPGR